MKTKLATLLIAPALLFTACGAKEISFKEALEFINEHYTLKDSKVVAKKINATWDFKFEEIKEDMQLMYVKNFLGSLIGKTLTEAEVKTVSGSFSDKEGTSIAMNIENFFDTFNDMYLIGSKFTLSGNELSISGPAAAAEEMVYIDSLKFTFNDQGATKEVHGLIEKQEIGSINEDKSATIEGKLDITFSDFVYPNL